MRIMLDITGRARKVDYRLNLSSKTLPVFLVVHVAIPLAVVVKPQSTLISLFTRKKMYHKF